jgi:hypothetical protein
MFWELVASGSQFSMVQGKTVVSPAGKRHVKGKRCRKINDLWNRFPKVHVILGLGRSISGKSEYHKDYII